MSSFKKKKFNFSNIYGCWDCISYIEFLLIKSDNNYEDKKVASFAIEIFFLNHKCRRNMLIREEAIKVCKLFLENEYIEKRVKDRINSFLIEANAK